MRDDSYYIFPAGTKGYLLAYHGVSTFNNGANPAPNTHIAFKVGEWPKIVVTRERTGWMYVNPTSDTELGIGVGFYNERPPEKGRDLNWKVAKVLVSWEEEV
jgi:hypothetical protein